MNNKGEMGVGAFIMIFIGVIVALILLQATAVNTGLSTTTYTLTNGLYTAPAIGSCIDLKGQELLSTPVVTNRTTGTAVPAVNYTITERVSSVDGLKRIGFCTVGLDQGPISAINVSYSYGAEGYAADSSSRAIIGLIIILSALAIMLFVLYYVLKDKIDW